jgi:hypothetical protein
MELTINNNIKGIDDQAFEQEVSDYILGHRQITGTMTMRARRDLLSILGERKQFSATDIDVTMGTTAGSICTVNLDCELDFSAVNAGEVGGTGEANEGTIEVPFTCVGDSAESELVITFT